MVRMLTDSEIGDIQYKGQLSGAYVDSKNDRLTARPMGQQQE